MRDEYLFLLLLVGLLAFVHFTKQSTEAFQDSVLPTAKPIVFPRLLKSAETTLNGVPMNVYMSWIDTNIPQKMQLVIDKNRELNPEFNFFIYSDDACRDYIRRNFEKEVVDAFDTLVPGAYKSDLWRYCILYKEGGVYMDIKMECKVPFSRLIKQQPITLVADLPHTYAVSITTGIWNGFMIYPPKNNVFRSCIDKIIENCNTKEYGRSPLDITGPHLIGDIVELEYPGQIKYKTLKMHTDGVTIMTLYDNEPILRTYKEYRNDQKKFGKKAHYSDYYWNHRVYLGE